MYFHIHSCVGENFVRLAAPVFVCSDERVSITIQNIWSMQFTCWVLQDIIIPFVLVNVGQQEDEQFSWFCMNVGLLKNQQHGN